VNLVPLEPLATWRGVPTPAPHTKVKVEVGSNILSGSSSIHEQQR